jgi:ATP-dependent DNA helicase RecG
LREIIVNAVVHRDYSQSSDTVIKVFDDKIEFFNPGGLMPGLTVEKLKKDDYVSRPRNKQIADAFKEAGIIEKYGTGIRRICEAFREHGLEEPQFHDYGYGFMVTVQKGTLQKTPQKKGDNLRDKILELMKSDPQKTRAEVAHELVISENTVKEYIAKLKSEGRLARKGSDRAGVWIVKEIRKKY